MTSAPSGKTMRPRPRRRCLLLPPRLCESAVNPKLPCPMNAEAHRRGSSPVTSQKSFVFRSAFSHGPRYLQKLNPIAPLRPLPPRRSPVLVLFFPLRLCASAVNPKLPRPMNAGACRRGSSVVIFLGCGSAALRGRMVSCAPTGSRRWPARVPASGSGFTTRCRFTTCRHDPSGHARG